MVDSKRWSVTYTKHLKQKRKVYQDGFLDLHASTSKVMLYDECEKLLECRLLKKDETVVSGETLAFNGYVVDIGGREGDNNNEKPQSDLNVDGNMKNVSRFRTPTKDTEMNAKENMARSRKPLSPSQKIIKEFKKRELLKYESPKISPEATKTSTTEYQVLYTTQVTQKAKKYHDGFLRLVTCGSHGTQVMLFDASRKLLDSRFLKKDDMMRPGESLEFDAYLVDIGDCQGSQKPDSSVQWHNCTDVERMKKNKQETSLDSDTDATVRKSEWQVLYTTQLTQKAKKYHDGFLQLEFCGSRGRQVVLYDLSKRPLERRFLKKDEVIRAGESVYFDGHLVDVGEPEGSHLSLVKLNERGTVNSVGERRQASHGQNGCLKVNPSVAKGQPPSKPCLGQDAGLNFLFTGIEEKRSNMVVHPIKPLRDANQILSILQDPMCRESNVTGGQSPYGSCNVMNKESTETMKSFDITSSRAACVGSTFKFIKNENAKMSHQVYSDMEDQTNRTEADFDLFISSSSDHSSCLITSEDKSAEESSCKVETFPSFDLGF